MTPIVLLTILDKVTGALVAAPILITAAERIKELLSVDGSDFDVQLQGIKDGAVTSADETLEIIAKWRETHPE